MKYILHIVTFIALSFFQSNAQQNLKKEKDSIYVQELLNAAKKYASRNIDSAEQDARQSLALAQKNDLITLEIDAYRFLGIILAQKGGKKNLEEAISHFNNRLDLSRKIGDSTASLSFASNMTATYLQMKNYSQALKYGVKAVELSQKLRENKEYGLGIAHGNLANVYSLMHLNDSALVNYKKSKLYFERIKSPYEYYIAATIGELLKEQKKYDESYNYLKYAYDGLRDTKDYLNIARISNLLGGLLLKLDNDSKAKEYYNKALGISVEKDLGAIETRSLYGLAKIFYNYKNLDSANVYIDKALKQAEEQELLEEKAELFELKANVFTDKGNPKEAIRYYHLSKRITDSLNSLKNVPEATEILIQKQNKVNEEKVDSLLGRVSGQNHLMIIFIASFIVLSISVYFLLKRYKLRLRTSHINTQELEASLQSEKDNNAYINRKLVAATANLALKTDLLTKVNNLLGQIKRKSPQNLTQEIRETQNQIKIQQNLDTMWKEFFTHFEEVHPEFLKNLKSKYNITQHDLKICAFLKMNLSNKEICQLMNINPSTVRVNIHRIKKKLNIPKETSVSEFFSDN